MRYDHAVIRYVKLPLPAEKIIAIVGQRCPEALGGAARASGQAPIEQGNLSWSAFAPAAGDIAPLQHISGPDETTVGLTWLSGDEVQRVVHTVGEVAVEVPGGTEHCLISIRHAPKGVRAGVAFTRISLDLGYSNGHSAIIIRALQDAAEYFGCEIEHLTRKKCPVRDMKFVQNIHLNSVSTPRGQVSMTADRPGAEGQDTNRVHFDDAFGVRSVALDLPTSFPGIIADSGMEIAYGVIGRSAQGSSFITRIVAPSELFSLT